MPIAKHILTLEALSIAELNELKVTLQYNALALEKRIARLQRKLNRDTGRYELLQAARTALMVLHQRANDTVQVLEQGNAPPSLLEAQEALVAKYQRELEKLPDPTCGASNQSDIKLLEMQIHEMELKLQHSKNKVTAIDALLEA